MGVVFPIVSFMKGNYEQLMTSGQEFATLIKTHVNSKEGEVRYWLHKYLCNNEGHGNF